MILDLKIQCEHNDCFEKLRFTGEAIKDILKNDPKKLLEIIEKAEERFPEPSKGKGDNTNNDSFLMMAAASSSAF